MAKQDHPTLEFIIERGKLVPADPYVAEVMDTYRNGDKLTVTLNQKRSLPLLKKYWAVLRDVVENCKTPWENADQASDALKLALGVTDISKTVNGQWFIRPGSISFASMDENDFRPFFEKSMAVLSEVTGIDPEELRKRYRHIPESSAHPPADEGSDTAASSPSSVAANPSSAQAETSEAGSDNMGESETEPASNSDFNLMIECRDKFLQLATNMELPPEQRRHSLITTKDAWKDALPKRHSFVKQCFEAADRIIKGDQDATAVIHREAQEREFLSGLVERAKQ